MLQKNLLQASSLLAVTGIASTAWGLFVEDFKPLVLGFVLVLGAGVFATLYLGTCRASQESVKNDPES